ncbi:MAG: phosphotransferase family protein [Burkholderiaceae bacterium]|nr:phosphotransferase family protein [Burkholderiaceae bacterium]
MNQTTQPTIDLADDVALSDRIATFLSRETGDAIRVTQLTRFPVGFSWLTFAVTLEGFSSGASTRELILRLGPDYGLFAPYSAMPQVLAMQSLTGSAVPVPAAYWHSDDPSLLGAPFLFSERATGTAVIPWASASLKPLDDTYRLQLAEDFIAALAALHCTDWEKQPIAPMGEGATRENAAARELDFWQHEYERWAMRPYPLFEWGLRWLRRHEPVAPRLSIIHGDYRTGNFLEVDGRITSILDWELVHIGDPHDDLGWASLPMYMGGTKLVCRLIERERFFEAYQARVPFEVSMSAVTYYQALSLLKLAATHMAAARCFEDGRFNDMRMPAMGSQILPVLRQLEKAIESA